MSKPHGQPKGAAHQLATSINEVSAQSAPERAVYFRNLQAALQGRGEDIPAAQEAYRASLAASQQGLRETGHDLRGQGLESRFASPILDRLGMEGRRSAEDARQAVINAFLGQAPSTALETTAQGQAGLLSSAQRGATVSAVGSAAQGQAVSSGAGAIGSLLGALLATR